MYLFPRQYGLHNVFTSVVNRQQTVQPFQDYTDREVEIDKLKKSRKQAASGAGRPKLVAVPQRLKGKVLALVVKMQKLHRGCQYHALIKHYCPVSVSFVHLHVLLLYTRMAQSLYL